MQNLDEEFQKHTTTQSPCRAGLFPTRNSVKLVGPFCAEFESMSYDEKIHCLCVQLRVLCDKNGIESNPTESAKLFHKLAVLHFRESPEKVSLIQSIGLLNSAIIRKPNNISDIKKDLFVICQHILQQAKAQSKNVNLIAQAHIVKSEIASMRDEANRGIAFMKNVKTWEKENNSDLIQEQKRTISLTKLMQIQIKTQYLQIMYNLCQYCINIMGPSPCDFAVVGMGSLARNEITPYSDFEHIILLEIQSNYKNHLEYFRWFSVIFHTVILNLQETIIPSLNIVHLNDKTSSLGFCFFDTHTNGISFDGMMPYACKFPLGRTQHTKEKPWTTELIKPVDKMLEYLGSEVSLKNGYHLSDVLTETCFVYGNKIIYNEFQKGIQSHRSSKTHNEIIDEIRKQIKADLDKYATRIRLANLKYEDKINVKQTFYRTSTLFIATLGKICGTTSSSCLDIINELAEKKIISEHTKHKLSYAVAIACEIRLNVYMKMKSQRDYIQPQENDKTIFDEILKIIDRDSIISYFQITYCLQRVIINLLGITETHIYSNASLLNLTICYALKLDDLMLSLLKLENYKANNFAYSPVYVYDRLTNSENDAAVQACINFDKVLVDLEKEIDSASKLTSQPELLALYYNLLDVSNNLLQKGNIDEALEFLTRILEILQRLSLCDADRKKIREKEKRDISDIISVIIILNAFCLVDLNRFIEALVHINQAFDTFDMKNNEPKSCAGFYFLVGNLKFKMKEYNQSLACLQLSLGIFLSENLDNSYEFDIYDIMILYSGIGACLLTLNQYEEAIIHLKIAVKLIEDYELEEPDYTIKLAFSLVSTFRNLGECFLHLKKLDAGFLCLFQALEIASKGILKEENGEVIVQLKKHSYSNKIRAKNVIDILYVIGLRYMKENQFKLAVGYLQQSFNILNMYSKVEDIDSIRVKLLTCYLEIYQRKQIKKYLKDITLTSEKFTPSIITRVDSQFLTYALRL